MRRIEDYDRIIAEAVKAERIKLGLSQANLAAEIGVTFQQVQKYESGKDRISCGKLYKIAKVLRVPIFYFYKDIPQEEK